MENNQELEKVEELIETKELKNIKLRTKFDFRTMKYCNLYILKYQRKTYIFYAILILISVAAAIYLAITNPDNPIWAVVFGVIGLYTVYQALTIEKNLDKHLTNFFYNRPVVEQEITLNEENITILSTARPNEPIVYDWSYVYEIHEIPQYYLLFMGKNAPIILDKSSEALLDGTKEELKDLIKAKSAFKPYKYVEKELVKKPITYVHNYVAPEESKDVDEVINENIEENIINDINNKNEDFVDTDVVEEKDDKSNKE